jgi:hypothetical protein
MGKKSAYRDLVRKLEGNSPRGRPRCRWEDNIKMDLKEVGWRVWTGFIWLRIGTIGGSCEHMVSIKCWEFLGWLSIWWLFKKDLVKGTVLFALGPSQSYPVATRHLLPSGKLTKHGTDHSSLMPRLRMCGCLPPCPLLTFIAWCISTGIIFIQSLQHFIQYDI